MMNCLDGLTRKMDLKVPTIFCTFVVMGVLLFISLTLKVLYMCTRKKLDNNYEKLQQYDQEENEYYDS